MATSSSDRPSHGPTCISPKRSSILGSKPTNAASGAAVANARRKGLDTIDPTSSPANARATAFASPSEVGSILSSSHPITRFCVFHAVRP